MGAIGAPEILILVLLVFPTVYGAYKAFTSGDTGWGIAILAGWVFALGWLIGIVYLIQRAVRRKAPAS